jgi:hypothetical protein
MYRLPVFRNEVAMSSSSSSSSPSSIINSNITNIVVRADINLMKLQDDSLNRIQSIVHLYVFDMCPPPHDLNYTGNYSQ